jgi:serine/threonine-protein kinase RIO1
MDVLEIERGDGAAGRFRSAASCPGTGHEASTPEEVTREFDILRLVESAGIPAPRPILLDTEGECLASRQLSCLTC